ncbi:hypothetical protein [Enterococcus olivae]
MRFQWLKDYQELEQQILYLRWNLNKSKLELDRWVNGDLANVRLDKNSRSAKLEENIEAIEKELDILYNQKEETEVLVSSFEGLDNEIVMMKYIHGKTLEEIASDLSYSYSYIKTRHAALKKYLDFTDEYIKNKVKFKYKLSRQSEGTI